jgi:7-cyano-7-deazaguanine tRNA-ribosyltransferase
MHFEIMDKDVMGRICKIVTPHGKIETPAIFPVINPNIPFIGADEMRKFGAEAVITNSYIIYRTMRDEGLKKGVHGILRTDMPVMTDSGSYQLMVYGDVEINNREILEFQKSIGSDIIVPLDIPTPPDAERETAERDLKITLEREREAAELRGESLLALPIQGSTYMDLRRFSAREAKKIGGDIYPIGAVVPLMDTYRFQELVRIILEVRSVLKVELVHLFGCGHPMIFAMAVALGCDLFDSAAYALYAKDDRYLTVYGTKKLSEMNYFPCSCPACIGHTPEELRRMEKDERERIIAEHNLYVSFQEIKTIKQAIKENSLFELVEKRVRAHPYLLAAWRQIKDYGQLIEEFDPRIKRRFLYCGVESTYRPAVERHVRSLLEIELEGKEFTVTTDYGMVADFYLKPVFGIVPYEMLETYPAGHAEMPDANLIEKEAIEKAVENLYKFMKAKSDKKFKIFVSRIWVDHLKDLPENGELHVLP